MSINHTILRRLEPVSRLPSSCPGELADTCRDEVHPTGYKTVLTQKSEAIMKALLSLDISRSINMPLGLYSKWMGVAKVMQVRAVCIR